MTDRAILKTFCSVDSHRPSQFHDLIHSRDSVYATCGRIIVRAPRTEFDPAFNEKFALSCESLSWPRFKVSCAGEMPMLPDTKWISCEGCNGIGVVGTCPTCDGSGKGDLLEDGEDYEQCEDCNGIGIFRGPFDADAKTHRCDICEGARNFAIAQRVAIGQREFNCELLRKLLVLPSLQFLIDDGPHDTALYFTFDGGDGLIMPMKKEERVAA